MSKNRNIWQALQVYLQRLFVYQIYKVLQFPLLAVCKKYVYRGSCSISMFVNVREMQLTLTVDDTLSRIHGTIIYETLFNFKNDIYLCCQNLNSNPRWTCQIYVSYLWHGFLLIIIQISIFIVGSTWHIMIPLKRSARPDIMESSENYSICYASLFIFEHRVC